MIMALTRSSSTSPKKALGLATFLIAIMSSFQSQADDVENFYRGKTIDLVIGFTPGGGYDLYARLVAQFMGDHIPGKPRIISRTMAGAGSRTAAGYLANIAPKDGTVMAIASQSLALEQALGSKQQFDMTKFLYVGNPVQENNASVTWSASGIGSIEDAKRREVTVGSTGDDPSSQYPKVMNALLGTKFRIIFGYQGGNDIDLAMERGEVDGRGSSAVTEWKSNHADWLQQKKINVLVQIGLTRAAFLPDVPLLVQLAQNDRDRAVLRLLSAPIALGRPIFTTPDVPSDRVQALRMAFIATMKDPAFLAAARQQNFDLSPVSGEDMQSIVGEITSSSPEVTGQLKAILDSSN
jgi:tripartite-type tricarboxylate transporter receptor subunit TctC